MRWLAQGHQTTHSTIYLGRERNRNRILWSQSCCSFFCHRDMKRNWLLFLCILHFDYFFSLSAHGWFLGWGFFLFFFFFLVFLGWDFDTAILQARTQQCTNPALPATALSLPTRVQGSKAQEVITGCETRYLRIRRAQVPIPQCRAIC